MGYLLDNLKNAPKSSPECVRNFFEEEPRAKELINKGDFKILYKVWEKYLSKKEEFQKLIPFMLHVLTATLWDAGIEPFSGEEGAISIIEDDMCRDLPVEKYEVSEGVKEIKSYAFMDCINLRELHLPLSIKKIGMYAFSGCEKLNKVYYEGTHEELIDVLLDKVTGRVEFRTRGNELEIEFICSDGTWEL